MFDYANRNRTLTIIVEEHLIRGKIEDSRIYIGVELDVFNLLNSRVQLCCELIDLCDEMGLKEVYFIIDKFGNNNKEIQFFYKIMKATFDGELVLPLQDEFFNKSVIKISI